MREKFLEIPNIGQTYLIDILLFYYVPKVFVIENDNHEMFLLYEWTDDYSWFATQINKKEHEELLNKKMSIQNAFNDKKSYWLSKKDCILAMYCFSDNNCYSVEEQLKNIDEYLIMLEKRLNRGE